VSTEHQTRHNEMSCCRERRDVVLVRSIPVDVGAFTAWICVAGPEPRLVDAVSGEVRRDRQSGRTVYSVGLCGLRGRDSSVVQVSVVGEPVGLVVGAPVVPVGLEASPWERDGRSGVAWRAAQLRPVGQSSPGPEPAVPSTVPADATVSSPASSSASPESSSGSPAGSPAGSPGASGASGGSGSRGARRGGEAR
jgi:hypothetical protein